MPVDIRREADDLIRYYSELVRRLGQNGVRDIAELLALHEQLRRAVDAVSVQEIGWVAEQTQRLIGELVRMDSNLDSLRRLKTILTVTPEPGLAPEPHAR
jgi:DNA-binding GntR family transcriptional regulator